MKPIKNKKHIDPRYFLHETQEEPEGEQWVYYDGKRVGTWDKSRYSRDVWFIVNDEGMAQGFKSGAHLPEATLGHKIELRPRLPSTDDEALPGYEDESLPEPVDGLR
jgi:hypothetical protein